ncbi:hypothetical protein A8B78_11815 [Jannaschia sp. EhC01]|nr:hypothetical protein A8B78_11815 [Jannaschia sp. EhC01]
MDITDKSQPQPQILILGAQGSNGSDGAPGVDGVNSEENKTGQDGDNGTESWIRCHCAGDGTAGAPAESGGGQGGNAKHGLAAPPFSLTASCFVGQIRIVSQGGTGGEGGAGGIGGSGAKGGDGGTNCADCLKDGDCNPTSGGTGGDAGNGGLGGKGGDGGNGGRIEIFFSGNQPTNIVAQSFGGKPGGPGTGGQPGQPGQGGYGEEVDDTRQQAFPGRKGAAGGNLGGGEVGKVGTIKFTREA